MTPSVDHSRLQPSAGCISFPAMSIKLSTFRLVAVAGVSLVLCATPAATGKDPTPTPALPSALARATVLIIRHAEEPDHGNGLSAAGTAHAEAYVNYFEHYSLKAGAVPIELTALFAAANSNASHRSVLTLTPLSQALGLPLNAPYKDNDYAKLAEALRTTDHGRYILVCWHHGNIPNLVRALGGDPHELLPDGKWPSDQYGWVIQLRYDKQGDLKDAKLVVEGL